MLFGIKKKRKRREKVSEKEIAEKRLKFFNWIQEFSKKIVVISFFIYIIMDIISLIMVICAYIQTGDLMYIDTIIIEANQTFRDVIGGYILKAATENISKGICMILEKFLDIKTSNVDNIVDEEDPENNSGEDGDIPYLNEEDNIAGSNEVKNKKVVFDH